MDIDKLVEEQLSEINKNTYVKLNNDLYIQSKNLEILKMFNIDYETKTKDEIKFLINDLLNSELDDYEYEILDKISQEIDEINYYNFTNK